MSDAEELARKRKVRGGHRGSTTRILGQVEHAIAGIPPDVPKITQLKRSLEEKLQSLSTLDDEILELVPVDTIDDEILQADETKEKIYTALYQLEFVLKPIPLDDEISLYELIRLQSIRLQSIHL